MEGNLLLLSPLTPLEHRYPSTLLCFLHPLSSPSYDSFGSDLLTILLPPRSYFPQPPPIRCDRRLAILICVKPLTRSLKISVGFYYRKGKIIKLRRLSSLKRKLAGECLFSVIDYSAYWCIRTIAIRSRFKSAF